MPSEMAVWRTDRRALTPSVLCTGIGTISVGEKTISGRRLKESVMETAGGALIARSIAEFRARQYESISTNGTNRPTQRRSVRNVWRCHWHS